MYNIKYPVAFHPVDMAITRVHEGRIQVCLAQKVKDAEGGKNVWRFPGGFVDPWDSCAEEAAFREAGEETGMVFALSETKSSSKYFTEYFAKKNILTEQITKLIEGQPKAGLSPSHQEMTSKLLNKLQAETELKITKLINELHEIKISDAALAFIRSKVNYIGSTKIDDARYRETDHKVITSFYELQPIPGHDNAGEGPFDDIARTKWFHLNEIKEEIMHPAHKVLFAMLFDKYKTEMAAEGIYERTSKMAEEFEQAINEFGKDMKEVFSDIEKKMPAFKKTANETVDRMSARFKKIFESLK